MAALALGGAPDTPALAKASPPPVQTEAIPVLLLTDLGSGRELVARQPDLPFVPASMTKVMTAKVAFREIAAGRLDPRAVVTVPATLAREWNGKGASLYLKGGDKVSVDRLLAAIVTVSANDAAMVLASHHGGDIAGWSALMNREARRLGMASSRFATPSGWPDNGATHVSARDLVRLARALLEEHPADYRRYFGRRSLVVNGAELRNRDPVTGVVAGADGIKTGYTREAGHNFLGSAERDGTRLVMVVAGARSEAERAGASRALLEWGFTAWQRQPLFKAGDVVASARTQGGNARRVALASTRPLHATWQGGAGPGTRLVLHYRGPLQAPIAKGAQVAELEIRTADGGAGRVPLVAVHAVGKAGPMDRLVNGLIGLFS